MVYTTERFQGIVVVGPIVATSHSHVQRQRSPPHRTEIIQDLSALKASKASRSSRAQASFSASGSNPDSCAERKPTTTPLENTRAPQRAARFRGSQGKLLKKMTISSSTMLQNTV